MMRFATGGCVLAVLAVAAAGQPDREKPFTPFDRAAFVAHAEAAGASAEQIADFVRLCDESSPGIAADTLLRALFTDFAAAAALADDGDPRAALELGKVLAAAADRYVVAHARYHLGRAFLDADDPEGAAEVFADYLQGSRNLTPLDGEVAFFYGSALVQIPERQAAARVLQEFLQLFPDAPERYRASAAQLIAEIAGQSNVLHDVADAMKGIERRIRKTETGEETQQRQDDVIAQLQKIIEEVEERERQSSGGGGGNPTNPRAVSNLSPGATRIGNLRRVSSATDRWGMMKDRERREIENDAQAKLSGRYKKLVEDYYRKLRRPGQ